MSNWMIDASQLDEEQRQFIYEESKKQKNIWIKGFPGSGKSVLLIHNVYDRIKENPNVTVAIIVFTHSLIQLFKAAIKELNIPDKNIDLITYHKFLKTNYTYDYIFCDEVQDLPKSVLEEMKKRSKYLITAGDENQSIYEINPATHEPTINPSEIKMIIENTYELHIVHRLTKSIMKSVSKLISYMNMLSAKTDRTKKDVSIRLAKAQNEKEEVEYILSIAEESIAMNENVAIILPTHQDIFKFINLVCNIKNKQQWQIVENQWGKPDYYKLNKYLVNNQINIEYIGNKYGNLFEAGQKGKIIIMTYHSSKGLDFDNVFLPFVNYDLKIGNETLFMVGMTRSKQNLYLTYSSTLHPFVSKFEDECTKIDIHNDINNTFDDFDDFDF